VEFDAGHGNVLKDGWRVARFGEIECVQLSERGLGEEALYVVELRLPTGPCFSSAIPGTRWKRPAPPHASAGQSAAP